MSENSMCYSTTVNHNGDTHLPRPLQVVVANVVDGRTTFDLNEEALEIILLDPQIRLRKVCIVSVAGAFRQGKSFLLDFFLRYLDTMGCSEWIGCPDSPLEGFPWRGGSERYTTGILMWSKAFLRDLPNGEKVAVLLMDTQGAFDSHSTVRECATVFALSTMLSSVQIYNINGNIQEDHLQHLQLFTEYGRLALERGVVTPFQHLHFLVRDWPYPYEYEHGAVGGEKLIAKRLQVSSTQPEELQHIRRHIWSCFQSIKCYLMPHPGLEVSTNERFDGRISDITPKFIENIKRFVPLILHESNLVLKEINGQKIKCRDLVEYFRAYIKIYQGEEIPEPKSVLQLCGMDRPYIEPFLLESEHSRIEEIALRQFDDIKKMGGDLVSRRYREQLSEEIGNLFENYRGSNSNKNIFHALRCPVTLSIAAFCFYILWGVVSLVLTNSYLFGLPFFVFIVLLISWCYSRYTGNYAFMADIAEQCATMLHEEIVNPMILRTTQSVVRHQSQRHLHSN